MKRVIRKSVFETNSSSTHSLAFGKYCPNEYDWQIDDIEGKFKLALDLIDHALYEDYGWRDNYYTDDVEIAISQLDKYLKDNYGEFYNELIAKFGTFIKISFRSILYELKESNIEIPQSIIKNKHIKALCDNFDEESELVLRFRNKLIDEYLKITKKDTKEEKAKYVYNEPDGNGFSCYNWFDEGPLFECNCGLHDIYEIYDKLVTCKSEAEMEKRAKEIFTKEYCFFGKEEE